MKTASRRLTVILIAAAVLFGFSMYAAFYLAGSAGESQDRVLHTHDVMQKARVLLSQVQDAETGQRGYLLTGEESYLKPYVEAAAAIPGQIAQLKELLSDDPSQHMRLGRIEALVDERLRLLDQVIARTRAEGMDGAAALLRTNAGRVVMDNIRATIEELLAEEQRLLAERIEQTETAERETLIVGVLGALLGLVALAVAAINLAQNYRRIRRGEIALTRKTAELQATLDNCRDGIAVFGKDQLLTASNERFFLLFDVPTRFRHDGKVFSEFRTKDGLTVDGILHPQAGVAIQMGEGGGMLFEIDHNGRHLEIYRNVMPDGGMILSCADVTRRVRAEAAIRQAQKMEAIGHLTGGVAHDFNNLLQIIRTNLELLAGNVAGNSRAETRLRNALAGTERGARLTHQLLAYARRQPLAPATINLGRLVSDMTDMLRRTLGETIEIETIIAGGLWNTLVDPNQIENVIINLAVNARDAMPDGGKLTIELANATLDDAYAAQHSEVTPGQYVMLAVTDTGTGMTPEIMAHAFEPFYTTKGEGKGTGLGLSMVYGVVKQSEGHAKVYSEMGQGTTIKIYLPRSRRPEERLIVQPHGPAVGGTECILVVEDDAAVRRATLEMLRDLGYRVLEAEDGESALALLASGERVDLLFTDVVMPGPIGSRELARRAQAQYPGLAVLFTSGYTENAVIHHGRLDEDVQLISKPFGRDELAHRLRVILASSARAQPPAPTPAAPAPSAAIPSDSAPSAHQLKVLVVEDEPLILLATADQLEELGHEAISASNARDALRALDGRADIDVLLTDLGLPDMNGRELAAAVRQQRPDIRLVIATGRSSPADGGNPDLAGAVHLAKPFQTSDLARALEQSRGA